MAIIHLGQLLPNGSSDLPGGRPRRIEVGRAALMTPPYLVLHREEFAWPRMSPHAPVRSYIKPRRAAPFHPSPSVWFVLNFIETRTKPVGWFVFCCTCRRSAIAAKRPAVSGLAALWCSDSPLLNCFSSDRPTCSCCKAAHYSNRVFNRYSRGKRVLDR